jgi:uncharacterized membrane protein
MASERGFHRLVAFDDAVVAIAITLLILPLVDSASNLHTGIKPFLRTNEPKLWAFALSFVVIGNFWWGQHQMFERVRTYNTTLVWGVFIWLFAIVALPFPTELIGSRTPSGVGGKSIYVGTMLLASIGQLIQQWAIVRWPDLQLEAHRGTVTLDATLILAVLMGAAFVLCATPSLGLWPLLGLLLTRPLLFLVKLRRRPPASASG